VQRIKQIQDKWDRHDRPQTDSTGGLAHARQSSA
jgi:hypothetical protein